MSIQQGLLLNVCTKKAFEKKQPNFLCFLEESKKHRFDRKTLRFNVF